MQIMFINARLRLPEPLYRRLRHLAVDRTQPVSELLVEAAEDLVERAEADPPPPKDKA